MNMNSSVRITARFTASPELIFDAWLDPEVMEHWLFSSETNQIEVARIEPHVGGSFSILEHDGGEETDHFGKYVEIDRPRRLRFTLQVPRQFAGITLVTADITPSADGCVMEFTQDGVRSEATESNWRDMFETLAGLQMKNG